MHRHYNESVHRKKHYTRGNNTIPYKLARLVTFESLKWKPFAVGLSRRLCHRAASFTYFGEVLLCPHKRIVTITKVYIARNNIHVELIRFRKK